MPLSVSLCLSLSLGGDCSFASLNGTHMVSAELSDGSVHKVQVELAARARTRIAVPVG